jgi:hypothetical protein
MNPTPSIRAKTFLKFVGGATSTPATLKPGEVAAISKAVRRYAHTHPNTISPFYRRPRNQK